MLRIYLESLNSDKKDRFKSAIGFVFKTKGEWCPIFDNESLFIPMCIGSLKARFYTKDFFCQKL